MTCQTKAIMQQRNIESHFFFKFVHAIFHVKDTEKECMH